ncbi:MAG TPA: hypothetical protein DF699_15455 [Phycisphaerales bacterium]|nr:hypothetical protein [Phycisphaerales bacterium]
MHLREIGVGEHREIDLVARISPRIGVAEVDGDHRRDEHDDQMDGDREGQPHDRRPFDKLSPGGFAPADSIS